MGRSPVVFCLRALGLGDLLTALPALRAVAHAFPRHRRVLAAPARLAPLARLSGAVDDVVDARPLAALAVPVEPDVAVNLHGRGPQSHRVLLALRPRRLIAFANAAVPESRRGPRWRDDEHEVHRWCRLLEETGIAADPSRLELRPPDGDVPDEARGATLIHPGAASPARRWPAGRWAAVARAEAAAGHRVVITGDDSERLLAIGVAAVAGLPPSAVFAGRTDVLALARLMAVAARAVCGDTGVAHLATALGTPSVVLFGPTPPARWGPPADRPWHRALWAGRRGRHDGNVPDPGLLSIGVRHVLQALATLPPRPRSLRVAS